MRVRDAERYAKRLLSDYHLAPLGWTVRKFRMRKVAGRTLVTAGGKYLLLSHPIIRVNPEWNIQAVIQHEVAHAIVYEGGFGLDHSDAWRRAAYAVGSSVAALVRIPVNLPKGKHQYRCPSCSSTTQRQRRPRPGYELGCVPCRKSRGVWVRLREVTQ